MQKLPIPSLEETTEKFIRWSCPFVNDIEYQETKILTDNFRKSAEKLQAALIDKQQNTVTSWLYQDWIDSYLEGRESLTLSTNFTIEILPREKKDINFLTDFVAGLSLQASLWQKVQYPQETDNRGTAIDMSQFAILGGYCRIPQKGIDVGHFAKESRHIAIYYQDRLYKIEILDNNFDIVCLPDFENLFRNNDHNKEITLSTMGFMPSETAAIWRENLLETEKEYFSVIENALFVVTLIDAKTITTDEKLHKAMFLNGSHGWPFKSMHFIFNIFDNTLWANFEHTYQDAGTLVSILKHVKDYMDQNEKKQYPKKSPQLIKENLSEEQKKQLIDFQLQYNKEAAQISIRLIKSRFSKDVLTKYSVDALTQMIHIYAMAKVMKEPRSIYEAVAIPHFRNGRTECVRALSWEMWQFALALLKNDTSQEELFKLFNKAIEEHKQRIKACKNGHGVDRHLLGLKLIDTNILTNETDRSVIYDFFNSKAYKAESENFFSTSSLGNSPLVGVLIYNPATTLGYGMAYGQNEEFLLWHLSYSNAITNQAQELDLALQEGAKKIMSFLSNYQPN
ncbi:Choline/Carnitine o-acyltransferase [Brevinema andersonii]|uniref:Choline/Carnitine o-acyltransferase n=1 Tax=Brevinema andersonii TaxID=34097 RepID=A0A1I1D4E7_BREAD|nr:choline/carnitine O-acyltransferase [Brevinema andersonii]SFB67473.1 Choline/Carnitine o-acyltransferase [Brevinema andersonii]